MLRSFEIVKLRDVTPNVRISNIIYHFFNFLIFLFLCTNNGFKSCVIINALTLSAGKRKIKRREYVLLLLYSK